MLRGLVPEVDSLSGDGWAGSLRPPSPAAVTCYLICCSSLKRTNSNSSTTRADVQVSYLLSERDINSLRLWKLLDLSFVFVCSVFACVIAFHWLHCLPLTIFLNLCKKKLENKCTYIQTYWAAFAGSQKRQNIITCSVKLSKLGRRDDICECPLDSLIHSFHFAVH